MFEFDKRPLDYLRADAAAVDFDLDQSTGSLKTAGDITQADIITDGGPERAAGHLAYFFTPAKNRIVLTGNGLVLHLKSHEAPLQPFLLLLPQEVTPHKTTFSKGNAPLKACLERRRCLIEIIAVKRVARLKPKRISGAESGRKHSLFLAVIQEPVPQPDA